MTLSTNELLSHGKALDLSEGRFREMQDSTPLLGDLDEIRRRMDEQGYVMFRGFLDRDKVLQARAVIVDAMVRLGEIDAANPMGAVSTGAARREDLGEPRALWREVGRPAEMAAVTHHGRLIEFFESLFGEPVRPFDAVWLRVTPVGKATGIHVDNVYMNRGTSKLYTAWIPFGDVPLVEGPLIVLEGSNRLLREGPDEFQKYVHHDVDRQKERGSYGIYSSDPPELAERFGLPWATTDFVAGDIVIQSVFTLHGSLDNRSPVGRFRITTDTRYQPASEAIDERFVEH